MSERIILFDTETTGLLKPSATPLSRQPRVIEIYAVVIGKTGRTIGEPLHQIVNPGFTITEETTRITGIRSSQLVGKPPWSEVADEVIAFFAQGTEVVAHNLQFDMTIVDYEMERVGKAMEWPGRKTCTVEGTQYLAGRRLNLAALYKFATGEEMGAAHRADKDVLALKGAFLRLRKDGVL